MEWKYTPFIWIANTLLEGDKGLLASHFSTIHTASSCQRHQQCAWSTKLVYFSKHRQLQQTGSHQQTLQTCLINYFQLSLKPVWLHDKIAGLSLFILQLKVAALSTSHNSKLTDPWIWCSLIQADWCKKHNREAAVAAAGEISDSSGDKCCYQDLFVSNTGSVQRARNNSVWASGHQKPVINNSCF